MLRALSPLQARLLLVAAALFCLLCASFAAEPVSEVKVTGSDYSDIKLYHDIAEKVRTGTPYHRAARDLQHAHDYPSQPFVTIRLPTLAHMAATFGWPTLQAILAGFLMLTVVLWYRLAAARSQGLEPILVGVMILLGGAMVTQPGLIAMHDFWAGVLACAALAFRGGKRWPLAVLLAGLAMMIRELSVPFAALALAFALVQRRRKEAIGWAALLAVFAVVMLLHAQAVHAVVLPTDKQSAPWSGLRGLSGVLHDLTDTSVLNNLPMPLAFALIPLGLLGWAAAPREQALFGLLYYLGMAVMIALFTRPDNFYWACLLQPGWFIGFAFLPRALRDCAQAALARRAAAG
ncbi:MAG: hypothetical protein ACKOPQ_05945 [Novosphingobium sp.]